MMTTKNPSATKGEPTDEEKAVLWTMHSITKVIDDICGLNLKELDMLEDGWPELADHEAPAAERYYQNGVVELIYHFRQIKLRERELASND